MSDTSAIRSALNGHIDKENQGDSATVRTALNDVYYNTLDHIYNLPYADRAPSNFTAPTTTQAPTTPAAPKVVYSPTQPTTVPQTSGNWFNDLVNGVTQGIQGIPQQVSQNAQMGTDFIKGQGITDPTVSGILGTGVGAGISALQGLGAVGGVLGGKANELPVVGPIAQAVGEGAGWLGGRYNELNAATAGLGEAITEPLDRVGATLTNLQDTGAGLREALQGNPQRLQQDFSNIGNALTAPVQNPFRDTYTEHTFQDTARALQQGNYVKAAQSVLQDVARLGQAEYATLTPEEQLAASFVFDPLNFIPGLGIGEKIKAGKLTELTTDVGRIENAADLLPKGFTGRFGTPAAKVTEVVKSGLQNVLLRTSFAETPEEVFGALRAFEKAGQDAKGFDEITKVLAGVGSIPGQRGSRLIQGFGKVTDEIENAYRTLERAFQTGEDAGKLPRRFARFAEDVKRGVAKPKDLLEITQAEIASRLQEHMAQTGAALYPLKNRAAPANIAQRFLNEIKGAEALVYIGLSPVTFFKNWINGFATMAIEGINPLITADRRIAQLRKAGQVERAADLQRAMAMHQTLLGTNNAVRSALGQGGFATAQTGAFGTFMSKMMRGTPLGLPMRYYEKLENGMRAQVWSQTYARAMSHNWEVGKWIPELDAATQAVLHQYRVDPTEITNIIREAGHDKGAMVRAVSDYLDGKRGAAIHWDDVAQEMGVSKQDLHSLLDEHDEAKASTMAQEIAARVAQGESKPQVVENVVAQAAKETTQATAERIGIDLGGDLEQQRGALVQQWNDLTRGGTRQNKQGQALLDQIDQLEKEIEAKGVSHVAPVETAPVGDAAAGGNVPADSVRAADAGSVGGVESPVAKELGTLALPADMKGTLYAQDWADMTDAQREFAIGYHRAKLAEVNSGNPFPVGADTYQSGAKAGLEEIPAPKVAQREPWQMTRDEYVGQSGLDPFDSHPTAASNRRWIESVHYEIVDSAVREGKPVPAAVLADYPDLAKLQPRTFADVTTAAKEKGIATVSDKGAPINAHLINALNDYGGYVIHDAKGKVIGYKEGAFKTIQDVQTRAAEAFKILDSHVATPDAPQSIQDAVKEVKSHIKTPATYEELVKELERIGIKSEDFPPSAGDMAKMPAPKPQAPPRAPKEAWQITQLQASSKRAEKEFPLHTKVEVKNGKPVYTYSTTIEYGGKQRTFAIEAKSQPTATTMAERLHKKVVEQALADNLPVPSEVLADYPDLAPKAAPVAEQVAASVAGADTPNFGKLYGVKPTGFPSGGWYAVDAQSGETLRFGKPFGEMPKSFKDPESASKAAEKWYKKNPPSARDATQIPATMNLAGEVSNTVPQNEEALYNIFAGMGNRKSVNYKEIARYHAVESGKATAEDVANYLEQKGIKVTNRPAPRDLTQIPAGEPFNEQALYGEIDNALAEIDKLREISKEDPQAASILSRDEMVKSKARTQADLFEALYNLWNRDDVRRIRVGSDAKNRVMAYMRRDVLGAADEARMAATVAADHMDNAVMISRDGETTFDAMLGVLSPFQFWHSRFALQSLRRVADKPARLSWYLKLRDLQDQIHDDPRFPKRLKGKMFIPIPFVPQWAGGGMWFDPLEQATSLKQVFNQNQIPNDVTDQDVAASIRALAQRGAINQTEAANAIANGRGVLWDQTKQRLLELASSTAGADSTFDMFRPHLPLDILWKLQTGNADQIGVLFPLTRIVRAATGVNIEQPLKAGLRALTGNQSIPDWDMWEQYRTDRALGDMVGDGLLSGRDALLALIERKGAFYEQAKARAQQQMSTQTFSVFGGNLFPKGEQEYYKSVVLRNQLIDQAVAQLGGNPSTMSYGEKTDLIKANGLNKKGTPLGDFYDQNPAWTARQDVFAEPEQRLKGFLTDEMWTRYNSLSLLDKRRARNDFPDLARFIVNPQRDYDAITIDRMAQWVKTLRGYLPESQLTPTVGNLPQVQVSAQNQSARYQKIQDEQARLFNLDAMQPKLDTYNRLSTNDKRSYRAVNPEVDAYLRWYGQQMQANPDLDKLIHPNRAPFNSTAGSNEYAMQSAMRELNANLSKMAFKIGDGSARRYHAPNGAVGKATGALPQLSPKVKQALSAKKRNPQYFLPRDVYTELLSLFRQDNNGIPHFATWLNWLIGGAA